MIIMDQFNHQFRYYMGRIPHAEYADKRNSLCCYMGWSYWQFQRRLNGDACLVREERDRIEKFFNAKIFKS